MLYLSRGTALSFVFGQVILIFLLFAQNTYSFEKIDINTAPLEDLIKIVHIGDSRALELVSLRPFSSLDELIRINGISEGRLNDIKEQGLAFVAREEVLPEKEVLENYEKGIIFTEVLPSPEGADSENEYIEIYNQNPFDVRLEGWTINDSIGSMTKFTFGDTDIKAREFLVLHRTETGIILNNNGDELFLCWPDGTIVDSLKYEEVSEHESLSLVDNNWEWTSINTPGEVNKKEKEIEKHKESSLPENTERPNTSTTPFVSQISYGQNEKSLKAFLLALFISFGFGIIILIAKRKT